MRRVLVDECINPRLTARLRSDPLQLSVETVRDLGWGGRKDQLLIPGIEGRFDVFLTIDKGFEFQHDVKKLSFGIVVLSTANNQMPSYEKLLGELLQQIQEVRPGQVVHIIDPNR